VSGLNDLIVPALVNQLKAMAGQLDKGVAHAGDGGAALLEARLAPDMHPLSTQIKFSCGQAADTVLRLLGEPLSTTPDVGDMAGAKALIAETIAQIGAADGAAIDAASDRTISLDLPNGMAFDLPGAAYVRDWALPQFHFHTAMAYAILRNQGVPIGKADLVPHMFAWLRKPA
jgi:uncharacterized protein